MTLEYKLDTYNLSEQNATKITEELKGIINTFNILGCCVSLDITIQCKMINVEKISMRTENIKDIKLYYSNYNKSFILIYKNTLAERYLELPFNSAVCFDFVNVFNGELAYSRNCYISNVEEYEELELDIEENEEKEE